MLSPPKATAANRIRRSGRDRPATRWAAIFNASSRAPSETAAATRIEALVTSASIRPTSRIGSRSRAQKIPK